MRSQLITLQKHIIDQQRLNTQATGELTRLLTDLVSAIKIINAEVNQAGLVDILGAAGTTNVQGEKVTKLDAFSQEVIVSMLSYGGTVCGLASEEEEGLLALPEHADHGKYIVCFDPLDGSSNVDANVSVGTIFSVFRKRSSGDEVLLSDFLQSGLHMVAAGYVIYGPSTVLVYTTGKGSHGFTLDPSIGEFLLSHPNIQSPSRGKIYSINEGYASRFDEGTKKYLEMIKEDAKEEGRPYSARYIGSLVSDFHRNLLYGGIYLYPAVPKPKLRLLYEAAPLAFIAEQAGGSATDGERRILEIEPTGLHQRVPLVIGSYEDVQLYMSVLAKYKGKK